MKIAYKHLLNFLVDSPKVEDISKSLFQLGHEHEIENSIFDIEFTPNRGDCLSLLGLARDLNVFYETSLDLDLYDAEIPQLRLDFINNAQHKCSAISFLNIEIEDKIKPYKDYLESYFKELNLNKNNFFTDISNYIAYEMGQPTHCYDFTSLDKEIILTDDIEENKFKTLLGNEINIEKSDLVFLNKKRVINLAGIVGSSETSCSKDTRNALVECAHFAPESIMGRSVKYNLQSDAAHKFERGVDPNCQLKVLRRFIKIVSDHSEIKKISISNNTFNDLNELELEINVEEINNILGTEESINTYEDFLSKLGFRFENKIKVPSFRTDINHQNDLAEEFARVLGYNNISSQTITLPKRIDNINFTENNIRSFLVDNDFSEVINYPFCSNSNISSIKVDNPLDVNREYLRTNLMESLVNNVLYNEKRQKDSIKLFEISDVYSNNSKASEKRLSLVVSGRQGHNYKDFSKTLDKQYLIDLFNIIDIDIEEKLVEISRDNLDTKFKTKIFGLEVDINHIGRYFENYKQISITQKECIQYEKISEFPSIIRDISFSLRDKNSIKSLEDFMYGYACELIKEIFIFDFYENKEKKIIKLGFRIIFQSKIKTLTDNEVDFTMNEIMSKCIKMKNIDILGL